MFLAEQLYGISYKDPSSFEEIGLIAYGLIGNHKARLYKTCIDVSCDHTAQLPCNCDIIEAVTYDFEDWEYVSNVYPEGDYRSLFTEHYIEGRKRFRDPLYISGRYVKYTRVGDTLYLDDDYQGKIYVLYWGDILDEDGLPMITDKEAQAIATYCAYTNKYKEGLITNNGNIISVAQAL